MKGQIAFAYRCYGAGLDIPHHYSGIGRCSSQLRLPMYTPSHVIDVATVPRQSADGLVGIKAPELLLHVVDEETSEGHGKTDFEKAIPANSGKEGGVPMLIKAYPEHNCHHGGSN